MEISGKTLDLVLDIKKFSSDRLKNENDVCVLIESANLAGSPELFDDIIFTAKYLNGLGKILHSNISSALQEPGGEKKIDDKAEERIRGEFGQNVIKLTKKISKLISRIDKEDKKKFSEKYLSMSRASLVNLTNLIYDLSWVKQYMNSRKE